MPRCTCSSRCATTRSSRARRLQGAHPERLRQPARIDHLDRAAARAAIVGPIDRWNEICRPRSRRDRGRPRRRRCSTRSPRSDRERLARRRPDRGAVPPARARAGLGGGAGGRLAAAAARDAGAARRRARDRQRASLERTLGALEPHEQDDRGEHVEYLVTPSRTKIAQSFDDLAGTPTSRPDELRARARPARRAADRPRASRGGSDGAYEIFHDVLAEPVLAWRRNFGSSMSARARAAAAPPRDCVRGRRVAAGRGHGGPRRLGVRVARGRVAGSGAPRVIAGQTRSSRRRSRRTATAVALARHRAIVARQQADAKRRRARRRRAAGAAERRPGAQSEQQAVRASSRRRRARRLRTRASSRRRRARRWR